jgi:hypothetical protein
VSVRTTESTFVNHDASLVRSGDGPEAERREKVSEPRTTIGDDQCSTSLVSEECEHEADVDSTPLCPELFGHPEVANTQRPPGESFGDDLDLLGVRLWCASHQKPPAVGTIRPASQSDIRPVERLAISD